MVGTTTLDPASPAKPAAEEVKWYFTSFVLPCFREAGNIWMMVYAFIEAMEKRKTLGKLHIVELLYADDSPEMDTAAEIAKAAMWAEKHCQALIISVLRRPPAPAGLSLAIADGLHKARFNATQPFSDCCVVLDADGQHPAMDALLAAEMLHEDSELAAVLPTRYAPGAGVEATPGFTRSRRIISRLSGWFARTMLPQLAGLSDPGSGFFAIRCSRFNLDAVDLTGWKFLMALLAVSMPVNFAEMSYIFAERKDGTSKATLKQGLLFFRQVMRLRRQTRKRPDTGRPSGPATLMFAPHLARSAFSWLNRSPKGQFVLTGGAGVIVQLATLHFLLSKGLPVVRSTVSSIGAAILWNYLLNRFWTFKRSNGGKLSVFKAFTLRAGTAGGQIAAAAWVPAFAYTKLHSRVPLGERWWLYGVTLMAIVFATVLNWVGTNHWVFGPGLVPLAVKANVAALVAQAPSRRRISAPTLDRRPPAELVELLPEQHVPPRPEVVPQIAEASHARRPIQPVPDEIREWAERELQRPPRRRPPLVRAVYIALFAGVVAYVVYNAARNPHATFDTVVAAYTLPLLITSVRSLVRALYSARTPQSSDQERFRITDFGAPRTRFACMMAACREPVIFSNLGNVMQMVRPRHYPKALFHVPVAVSDWDDDAETRRLVSRAREEISDTIDLVVVHGEERKKAISLNTIIFGGHLDAEWVLLLDAETKPSPILLKYAAELIQRHPEVGAWQFPVKLMDVHARRRTRKDGTPYRKWDPRGWRWGSWWKGHQCEAYEEWFGSALQQQASRGFISWAGNTNFIRRDLLEMCGGMPPTLTEDAMLGYKLARLLHELGLEIRVYPLNELASQEQTALTLRKFVMQQTRWFQGFWEVKEARDWMKLPNWRQKLMAWETLSMPTFQAVAGVMAPISLIATFYAHFVFKAPMIIVLWAFLPAFLTAWLWSAQSAIFWGFCRAYGIKVGPGYMLRFFVSSPAYQFVLSVAAIIAKVRHILGINHWVKTEHDETVLGRDRNEEGVLVHGDLVTAGD